jgi:hypothetical protein
MTNSRERKSHTRATIAGVAGSKRQSKIEARLRTRLTGLQECCHETNKKID